MLRRFGFSHLNPTLEHTELLASLTTLKNGVFSEQQRRADSPASTGGRHRTAQCGSRWRRGHGPGPWPRVWAQTSPPPTAQRLRSQGAGGVRDAGWHSLVLTSRPRVRLRFAAVQGGVPHAAVVAAHVDLGPQTAGLPELAALLHFLPHLQVLLDSYGVRVTVQFI